LSNGNEKADKKQSVTVLLVTLAIALIGAIPNLIDLITVIRSGKTSSEVQTNLSEAHNQLVLSVISNSQKILGSYRDIDSLKTEIVRLKKIIDECCKNKKDYLFSEIASKGKESPKPVDKALHLMMKNLAVPPQNLMVQSQQMPDSQFQQYQLKMEKIVKE